MARMKAEVLREVLQRPHVSVLSSIRKDGRPYLAPIWFLWEQTGPPAADYPFYDQGVLWITGTYNRTWCKHLLRDPRASLCIETRGDPVPGYAAVDCIAEPVEQDIWPISEALARKYVGSRPGATEASVRQFVANMKTEPRLLFRLTPERWRCIDLTVYAGTRADMAHQQAQGRGTTDEDG